MRAVVTVVGKDKKGIIAKVSAYLAERSVNIQIGRASCRERVCLSV